MVHQEKYETDNKTCNTVLSQISASFENLSLANTKWILKLLNY